jgi:hypothetical protein
VSEHFLNVVHRPTRLDQPRSRFVTEIVEMQIDDPELCS